MRVVKPCTCTCICKLLIIATIYVYPSFSLHVYHLSHSLSPPFLGILGFFFGLVAVFVTDYNKVMKDGFFQGYNIIVWTVIGLQV